MMFLTLCITCSIVHDRFVFGYAAQRRFSLTYISLLKSLRVRSGPSGLKMTSCTFGTNRRKRLVTATFIRRKKENVDHDGAQKNTFVLQQNCIFYAHGRNNIKRQQEWKHHYKMFPVSALDNRRITLFPDCIPTVFLCELFESSWLVVLSSLDMRRLMRMRETFREK